MSSTLPPATPSAEESELLRLLVSSLKDYAIIMLDPDGRVRTWSPAAERLKGYKPDEIIGQHFSKFYPPEDIEKGKTERELKVAAETGRFEDEGWRVRKDGTRFWANVILTALRDSQGRLRGFGKVTRDLSERKRAEEQVQKQAQEILEMATVPVVQVWENILLVPLIGTLDSQRTEQLMERLLQKITDTGSQISCVDITGVPTIDTQTAQHLVETIHAVRLLGAEVILTGVRPSIAQTLVHLGINLANVTTCSSLKAGLKLAFQKLDVHLDSKS
jgi:PAS domain S-box-containing protein